MTQEKLRSFPRVKPSGCENCKGHANSMLDSAMDMREERDLLDRVIVNYLPKDEPIAGKK